MQTIDAVIGLVTILDHGQFTIISVGKVKEGQVAEETHVFRRANQAPGSAMGRVLRCGGSVVGLGFILEKTATSLAEARLQKDGGGCQK